VRKATCSKDRSRNEELKDLFAAHLGGKSSGWGNVAPVKSLHTGPWSMKGEAGGEG